MNDDESKKVVLLGLPRTGKSTYLGSIWQLIQDERDTTIVEVDLTGDRAYLQALGEQVAAAEEVRRTDVESEEGLALTVSFPAHDARLALDVPDFSGETLRMLVEDRTWHPRLLAALDEADAVLLFVHPKSVFLPARLAFTAEVLQEFLKHHGVQADPSSSNADEEPTAIESVRFSPRMACTAAKLVDALENVLDRRSAGDPLRVGLVVSAWDTVDGKPTPAEWLQDRLPAIVSFAEVNHDRVSLAVFGVSAQGGALPGDRDDLLHKGSVLERSFARNAVGKAVPLSAPLEWVLFP